MTFIDQFDQKANMLMNKLRGLATGDIEIDLFTEINHATLDAVNTFIISI
jgi:hypothetical protein